MSREGIMEALIDFAAVSGAIVFSLGVALSLEWFALNTLMKMMPVQQPVIGGGRSHNRYARGWTDACAGLVCWQQTRGVTGVAAIAAGQIFQRAFARRLKEVKQG